MIFLALVAGGWMRLWVPVRGLCAKYEGESDQLGMDGHHAGLARGPVLELAALADGAVVGPPRAGARIHPA
jgi:hypothetical protein